MNTNKRKANCELQAAQKRNPRVLKSRHSPLASRISPRRGILLLVVLSMLTLFLLIGTAFIVSANHYRQINKIQSRITEVSNSSIDQGTLLDEVINQLIRDTNNQNSTLRFHSLLRDMYGNDGAKIGPTESVVFLRRDPTQFPNLQSRSGNTITINSNTGSNVALDINMASIGDQFFWVAVSIAIPAVTNLQPPLRLNDDYYNGQLLTFTDGELENVTARIMRYQVFQTSSLPNQWYAVFTLLPLDKNESIRSQNLTAAAASDYSRWPNTTAVINGRPFNGTGAGFNPTADPRTARLNTIEHVAGIEAELSLLPNSTAFDFEQVDTAAGPGTYGAFYSNQWANLTNEEQIRLINGMGPIGLGGSDESYDAVDFQNMLLALMPSNPTELLPTTIGGGVLEDVGGLLPIPSLHRPALINYWWQHNDNPLVNGTTGDFEPNMLRRVMMRPSWIDHRNFTGSNPEFANLLSSYQTQPDAATAQTDLLNSMIYGPWDVDNDNDGVRDSVWVDFGAPAMENSDGKLVKPLAAILVLDMDGRLNINAHGSEDMANPNPRMNFTQTLAGGADSSVLPHGQGYGPAEISLAPLMPGTTPVDRWQWYRRFLQGTVAGDAMRPNDAALGINRIEFRRRRIGKLGGADAVPGRVGHDRNAQLKMQGAPRWATGRVEYRPGRPVLGGYASTPDWYGRFAVGLNNLGQPINEALREYNLDVAARIDSETPYEVDLSLGAARGESGAADDGAYSLAELERVLRSYDRDAVALPARIWELAGEFKDNSDDTSPDLNNLNLWRTTLTTDSYDLPVPSVVVPAWMVRGPDPDDPSDDFVAVMNKPVVGCSFADLLEYRLKLAMTKSGKRLDPRVFRREMSKLLPRDLANGLRLDINRPFGNGRDDDNDGVVDEPGEYSVDDDVEAPYWISTDSQLAAFTNQTTGKFRDDIDRDGDGTITNSERGSTSGDIDVDAEDDLIALHNYRRQMLARDLYVMAMTLADPFSLTTKEGKAKSRMLAQWAINVVDFRDPDNIMTAFEYDTNPFDGWAPDGNTKEVSDWAGPDARANTPDDIGGVVWGAESPELLLTETLAWHDRRTENHGDEDPADDEDGDGNINQNDRGTVPRSAPPGSNVKIPDSDFDQRFLPQGAGFIELYCPVAANPAANADTHDTVTTIGTDLGINMSAVDQTGTSPCWRLMVYKTTLDGNAGPGKDPDSLEFADVPKQADRCVYFTDFDPEDRVRPESGLEWDNDGVAFYSTLNPPTESPSRYMVSPGRYMVVGGGESGARQYLANLGSDTSQTRYSNIGITLDATQNSPAAVTLNGAATFTVSSDVASVALIDQPRRFTFSEPAMGYPNRIVGSTRQAGPPNSGDIYAPILDVPLDDQRLRTGAGRGLAGGGGGAGGGLGARGKGGKAPFQDNELRLMLPPPSAGGGGLGRGGGAAGGGIGGPDPTKAGRTVPGFSWVYLQRLANPLLPWNPAPVAASGATNTKHDANLAVNPYMTIDAMGVSVTVFNGLGPEELRRNRTGKGNQISRFKNVQAGQFFTSVERGRNNNPLEPANNLSQLQDYAMNRPAAALSKFIQDNPPASLASNLWNPESVGYTGKGIAGLSRNSKPQNTNNNFRANPECTLGFLNQPFGTTSQTVPQEPFPWFTWNNRPYANANELLMVPAYRSSQLLQAFSYRTAANNEFEYDGKVKEIELSASEKLVVDGPFGHLLNFFRTDSKGADGILLNGDDQGIAGLHRLLDYVHVPSPFVGTESWLNPASFGNSAVNSVDDVRYQLQPPYNKISSYREPGRVNLNTVVSAAVWDGGVLHRELDKPAKAWDPLNTDPIARNNYLPLSGHAGPLYVNTIPDVNGLLECRRGYPVRNQFNSPDPKRDNSLLSLHGDVPTFFANPFRASAAGSLVPLDNLWRPGSECTLLRREAYNAGNDSEYKDPLFAGPTTFDSSNSATFDSTDAARNSYFGYQPMTRLSSMTTSRSNVYAVWVTIGFFEVAESPNRNTTFKAINDPAGTLSANQLQALYERVYPDGYQLGREAGSETGDIRRVREFVMIDRTVPVAFEPGQNHNVDKAIRLRRRID